MICMMWLRAKSPEGFFFWLSKTRLTLSITQLPQTASYRQWVVLMIQDKYVCIPLFTEWMLIWIKVLEENKLVCKTKKIFNKFTTNFTIWTWYTCLIYTPLKMFKNNERRLIKRHASVIFSNPLHHSQGNSHYQHLFAAPDLLRFYYPFSFPVVTISNNSWRF